MHPLHITDTSGYLSVSPADKHAQAVTVACQAVANIEDARNALTYCENENVRKIIGTSLRLSSKEFTAVHQVLKTLPGWILSEQISCFDDSSSGLLSFLADIGSVLQKTEHSLSEAKVAMIRARTELQSWQDSSSLQHRLVVKDVLDRQIMMAGALMDYLQKLPVGTEASVASQPLIKPRSESAYVEPLSLESLGSTDSYHPSQESSESSFERDDTEDILSDSDVEDFHSRSPLSSPDRGDNI